jgi:carboxypeptidase C (cathepsin A)
MHWQTLMSRQFTLGAALFLAVALSLLPSMSIGAVVPPPVSDETVVAEVITEHQGEFGGRRLRYRASFVEQVLKDAQGKPQATLSATSYTLRVRDPARRPLLFAFNGGPGASSSPLHFGAFGPKRTLRRDDGSRALVPNTQSLLVLADLVFIDPVSTGFSRVLPGGDGAPYWSVDGDARAVLEFIRHWVHTHGRAASPLYIAGESYGGFRLATLAKSAQDLNLTGLVLISPALDMTAGSDNPGSDLRYVFELPTLAVTALHHGKTDVQGRGVDEVYDAAVAFARSDYLLALHQGAALPITTRDQLATRLAALTGLPAEDIAAANLRIDSEVFLNRLLKNAGQLVGRLDTRITGPIPVNAPADRPAAANDPALGLGPTNVIKSAIIGEYLRNELKVPAQRDYVSLTLDVNFLWNWRPEGQRLNTYVNSAPNIAALMRAQPRLRLLVVGGLYDLATPALGVRHAIEHAGLPLERVSWARLQAGHSPFDGDAGLAKMQKIFREFLQTAPGD